MKLGWFSSWFGWSDTQQSEFQFVADHPKTSMWFIRVLSRLFGKK